MGPSKFLDGFTSWWSALIGIDVVIFLPRLLVVLGLDSLPRGLLAHRFVNWSLLLPFGIHRCHWFFSAHSIHRAVWYQQARPSLAGNDRIWLELLLGFSFLLLWLSWKAACRYWLRRRCTSPRLLKLLLLQSYYKRLQMALIVSVLLHPLIYGSDSHAAPSHPRDVSRKLKRIYRRLARTISGLICILQILVSCLILKYQH